MIGLSSKGDFKKTIKPLTDLRSGKMFSDLDRYGQMGVDALARATPTETGKTSKSWKYKINKSKTNVTIDWYNTNVNQGVNIAVIIQYGHGTGNGGYIVGRDYINPAIRPIFDKIADDVWKKVSNV